MSKDSRAAYCGDCDKIYQYDDVDLFDGEVFCPGCAGRSPISSRYKSVAEARRANRGAKTYRPAKAEAI